MKTANQVLSAYKAGAISAAAAMIALVSIGYTAAEATVLLIEIEERRI